MPKEQMLDYGHGGADSQYSKQIYRLLSLKIAKILHKTPLTPNMITTISMLLGCLTAYLFYKGEYVTGVAALQSSFLLDFVDGDIARLKKMSSPLGYWYDAFIDIFLMVLIFLGISLNVYNTYKYEYIWWLSYGGISAICVAFFLTNFFKSSFKNADAVVLKFNKRQKIIKEFYFNHTTVYLIMTVFGLINKPLCLIYFLCIYGWLFNFGFFSYAAYKLSKES